MKYWTGSDTANDYKAAEKTAGITWESWVMNGLGGNDTLIGGNDQDTLIGGTGVDRLEGKDGNDIYYVDNSQDVVIETSGNGLDKVFSSAYSYTLSSFVENLELIESAYQGEGNSLNNGIVGNTLANKLQGWGGNDVILGMGGNDQIAGGTGADILYGGAGNDTLKSYNDTNSSYGDDSVNDELYGGAGDDYLVAGNGMDWLYGDRENFSTEAGEGKDTLVSGTDSYADILWGGKGDDLYILKAEGAGSVIELAGEGIDTVRVEYAAQSYSLGSNVENLELIGNTVNGAGNELNNVIKGNSLNNTLNGFNGSDNLIGNAGNDILYGGFGADNLNGGDNDDQLFGGEQSDILVGESGKDKLVGWGWSTDEIDSLIGNSDADVFAIGDYNDPYYVGYGNSYALVVDFNRAEGDKIQIHQAGKNNYTLGTGYFANAGDLAKADTLIQYKGDTVAVIADNTTITTADFIFG